MTLRQSAIHIVCLLLSSTSGWPARAQPSAPVEISGRYPHLAMYNHNGECGTGAVVPWADRLWVITYAPHLPKGSDDKLYEIDANLNRAIRPESVGGTPADRMVHRETNQLVIGPYFIDEKLNVRVIPPSMMPGRLTAAARDLVDPEHQIYVFDMEGTLYEVNAQTLGVKKLFDRVAPGAHGKGAYTGQGRLVIANNGSEVVNKATPALDDPDYKTDPEAAGVLAEWDGTTWRTAMRREFTDVTGPGGIYGAPDDKAPVWAIGWDKRSILLNVLDSGEWHTYRLPVADYSYVAKHGWYTEWPRIREVGGGHLLMNMHGQWFDFPKTFSAANAGSLRPIASYLKITGDFCDFNRRLVFGCDDTSIIENPLALQSQSNLWFTKWDDLRKCGRPAGFGGPWVKDAVKAGEPSTPYLLAGYAQRVVHLSHDSDQPVTFTLQFDADGRGHWVDGPSVTVPPRGYECRVLPDDLAAQWVRVKTDRDVKRATAYFHYGPGGGVVTDSDTFASLASPADKLVSTGTLRPLGKDRGTLWFDDKSAGRAMEMKPDLSVAAYDGTPPAEAKSATDAANGYEVSADEASIIVSLKNARYRLPIADAGCDRAEGDMSIRHLREVVTERFLLNAGGSFFMVPRASAGGPMRLKPVCTHGKRFTDFCSWRGLLAIAGTRAGAKPDGHYFGNGAAGLWLGDVDDLWRMGKPRGDGGPWLNTSVTADQLSDPYLMAGYDHKTVELSHDGAAAIKVTLDVDFLADGTWQPFRTFDVPPGQTVKFDFPAGYSAQWVRARCDTACKATVKFHYE